jgi:hypothetical protein
LDEKKSKYAGLAQQNSFSLQWLVKAAQQNSCSLQWLVKAAQRNSCNLQ